MFCPSCGANNTTDQKFCRSCGMNLSDTISAYLQQFPQGAGMSVQRKEQLLERFGQIAFGGFGLIVFTGIGAILYVILTRMILEGRNFWVGILLFAFVVFASLSLAFVFLRESLKEKKQKLDPQIDRAVPTLVNTQQPGSLPDGVFQPAQSVIEDTTDLLPAKPNTRELQ